MAAFANGGRKSFARSMFEDRQPNAYTGLGVLRPAE
jgi:hypothetical protein